MVEVATVALASAAAALLASPYLSGLTLSVPDRGSVQWWRPQASSSTRRVVTAAVAAVFAAMSGSAARWTVAWPAYLALALAGVVLAIIDTEHHRLPDRMIVPAAGAAAAVFVVVAALDDRWAALGRTGTAAGVVFVALAALALISPRGVGFGDVKLAALLAGCLAWRSWRTVGDGLGIGILAAGIGAVVLMVAGRANRRSHIPLGPFLITAALLAVAVPL